MGGYYSVECVLEGSEERFDRCWWRSVTDECQGSDVMVDSVVVLLCVEESNKGWLTFLSEYVCIETFSNEEMVALVFFLASVLLRGKEFVSFALSEDVA